MHGVIVTSDAIDILSGVPRGTVLGPLLFLVDINDNTNCVLSSCHLFADDWIIYRQIDSPTDAIILQVDLLQLKRCMGKDMAHEVQH